MSLERLFMSNDVAFKVSLDGLVVNKDELAELVAFVRNKSFLHREYAGKDKGFAGGEWDYVLVRCDEKSRMEITPVPENIWLYLNTFGKEEK